MLEVLCRRESYDMGHSNATAPKPRAGLACFRAGCARDFTVAASGAVTWFNVISGAAHVVAVPPTTDNLEAYTFWQTTERWEVRNLRPQPAPWHPAPAPR